MIWSTNLAGQRDFAGGTEDFELAAKAAATCAGFTPDDEDEQVSDDPQSCYDCRYRRWTAKSIVCLNERVSVFSPPQNIQKNPP